MTTLLLHSTVIHKTSGI